jgi:kinesin family protein 26
VLSSRSRLHLIDIGNTDRSKSSGGKSVWGLGRILLAIFSGHQNLPYRDQKLTQILNEYLGSLTCCTTMIVHVSPNSHQYNNMLTTCQLASRIHCMRRRKVRFINADIQNVKTDGSSREEVERENSEYDLSSSDLSADTVIYVGSNVNGAIDGKHPPVYIASINSDDNRFVK